jgi:ATP-dependent DNA helicase RecQ
MLPTTTDPPKYSFAEIRAKAIKHLGSRPCLWQIRVVEAILKRDGDVVCIAATGSGKTLTFWLPLLFRSSGIQLIISPLNILGQQNVAQLAAMNINGITITAETATPKNFQVRVYLRRIRRVTYVNAVSSTNLGHRGWKVQCRGHKRRNLDAAGRRV